MFSALASAGQLFQDLQTAVDIPDRSTIARAKVRLDVACMLAARHHTHHGRLNRYLSVDKSPQNIEILFALLDEIPQGSLDGLRQRMLPLSAMAFCYCGVLHTALAIIHKIFLEHGPLPATMRTFRSSVRCICTDHSSVER